MATTPSHENLRTNSNSATSLSPKAGSTGFQSALETYLQVTAERYNACLKHVDHEYTFQNAAATLRLHYVRTDADGRPKFKELARVLAWHIGHYAITAQRHAAAKDHVDHAKIISEAKKLLRRTSKSGEPGELLLYFLLESVLKAPQAICKMSLKTNRNEEIKGSDGVHIRWDSDRRQLIVYFGEAKLYQDLSAAIAAAFTSMETFYEEGAEEHEVFLVSNHFNLVEDTLKKRVCAYLDKTSSPATYETHHACLVGFDWEDYKNLDVPKTRKKFLENFEQEYIQRAAAIRDAVEARLGKFSRRHLAFEFFFLPFRSVQEFREWFMLEVFGEATK